MQKVFNETEVNEDSLVGNVSSVKSKVKQKIRQYFKDKLKQNSQDKSKIKYMLDGKTEWSPGTRSRYMNELTRRQVSTIFRARSRMLNIKGNMKSHYKNKTTGRFEIQCRACNQQDETQPHILESTD